MQENFIHFLSSYPCQLSINGQSVGIIDNSNTLELDIITKTENIYVSYNPISNGKNLLPYTFKLNTQNIPISDNAYIKIIPFPNNNYDIIMTPFYYYQIENSKIILNQQIGEYYINITSDNISRVTIFNRASIVFTINTIALKSAKAIIEKDIIIIEGIIDDYTYYLLVINASDFSIIHNDISHSIENSDDYIQTLKNLKDISHHAIVHKIDKRKKTCQDYRVYENNICTEPHSPLLIPKVFLEGIKNHDEALIKKHLTQELSFTPLSKFQDYFGNIQEIYFNRHLVLQDKLNYSILTNTYKNYNFIMENNKIKDIEEIF